MNLLSRLLASNTFAFTVGILIFSLVFIVGIIIIIMSYIAEAATIRGRSGAFWVFMALITTPLFALLLLIAIGDTEAKKMEKWLEQEKYLRGILQSLGNKSSGKEEIDKEKRMSVLENYLKKLDVLESFTLSYIFNEYLTMCLRHSYIKNKIMIRKYIGTLFH